MRTKVSSQVGITCCKVKKPPAQTVAEPGGFSKLEEIFCGFLAENYFVKLLILFIGAWRSACLNTRSYSRLSPVIS
jgi:hypothetical protein